ncbi:MAG: hypothetical protein R2705_20825 [Ilumatobacteraceae bacterium]
MGCRRRAGRDEQRVEAERVRDRPDPSDREFEVGRETGEVASAQVDDEEAAGRTLATTGRPLVQTGVRGQVGEGLDAPVAIIGIGVGCGQRQA